DRLSLLPLFGIDIGPEHHRYERICAHADASSSEHAILHVFLLRSLRLAIVHARGVCTNHRLPSTRPPDSRRAAAARGQNPFAFAPSEAAISRRFRWPLPLPSSRVARCPPRQSELGVPRHCTLRPQEYWGRTDGSARRWRRSGVHLPHTTSPIRARASRRS